VVAGHRPASHSPAGPPDAPPAPFTTEVTFATMRIS
jgi:hypothetical protein